MNKQKKPSIGKNNKKKNPNAPSISISKIDESYNTDKAPDTFTSKEDIGEYNRTEHDNKRDLQDIASEDSSINTSSKVRNKI